MPTLNITDVVLNDDSAKVYFDAVEGALDYRAILATDMEGMVKFSGGNTAIELNGLPVAGTVVTIQALDNLGPYYAHIKGEIDEGLDNIFINGHGDVGTTLTVLASAQTFIIPVPRSLYGTQQFFDRFQRENDFIHTSTYNSNLNVTFESPTWNVDFRRVQKNDVEIFNHHEHMMTFMVDYLKTAYASCVMTPKASADISNGRTLHVTWEVDAHFSTRRWVDLIITPNVDTLNSSIVEQLPRRDKDGNRLPRDPLASNGKCFVFSCKKQSSYVRLDDQSIDPLQAVWKQNEDRLSRNLKGPATIDFRTKFDLFLSTTRVRVLENNVVIHDYKFPYTLDYDKLKVWWIHQLYHTANEVNEQRKYNPLETYWINKAKFTDLRHWDNMGFQVLPAGVFSEASGSASGSISVYITPTNVTKIIGQTQQFISTVSSGTITWTVVGNGTINASGLYTTPNVTGTDYVVAYSNIDPSISAIAVVTIVSSALQVVVSPSSLSLTYGSTGRYTAVVYNDSVSGNLVTWSIPSSAGTINSFGVVTAGNTQGTYTVTASSVTDPNVKGTASLYVGPPVDPIEVQVDPVEINIDINTEYFFIYQIKNADNTAVIWSVVESNGGSVDSEGSYMSPNHEGIYHVRATSVQDPTAYGEAIVNVVKYHTNITTSLVVSNVYSAAASGIPFRIEIGPLHNMPNRFGSSKAIEGVVIDFYPEHDDPNTYAVGHGLFTATTDRSGKAYTIIGITYDTRNWAYRITYPIGTYDESKPNLIKTLYDILPFDAGDSEW